MLAAILLTLFAAGWRFLAIAQPALGNFSPLMALTFCGAVYFKRPLLWLAPFVALTITDIWLDRYYTIRFGESWTFQSEILRLLCFALALPIGRWISRRRNWINVLSGSLGCSLLFYLVTNTDAWRHDPNYMHNLSGWWQALTIGRPEYPPTFLFFRNTLLSDLLFTGLFALLVTRVEVKSPAAAVRAD